MPAWFGHRLSLCMPAWSRHRLSLCKPAWCGHTLSLCMPTWSQPFLVYAYLSSLGGMTSRGRSSGRFAAILFLFTLTLRIASNVSLLPGGRVGRTCIASRQQHVLECSMEQGYNGFLIFPTPPCGFGVCANALPNPEACTRCQTGRYNQLGRLSLFLLQSVPS
jgi:hypothetical protein